MSDEVKKGEFEFVKIIQIIAGFVIFGVGILAYFSPNPELNSMPFLNGFISGIGLFVLVLGLLKAARQYGTENPVIFLEEGS